MAENRVWPSGPKWRSLPVRRVEVPEMRLLILLSGFCAVLAGCGADGAPERPAPKGGLTVEGEALIGVSGTL